MGSEQGYTIREIVDKVGEISGTKVLTNDKLARSFDCNYNVLNISRIKTELNWQPRVKLEEGLTCVWEWIKTGYNGK